MEKGKSRSINALFNEIKNNYNSLVKITINIFGSPEEIPIILTEIEKHQKNIKPLVEASLPYIQSEKCLKLAFQIYMALYSGEISSSKIGAEVPNALIFLYLSSSKRKNRHWKSSVGQHISISQNKIIEDQIGLILGLAKYIGRCFEYSKLHPPLNNNWAEYSLQNIIEEHRSQIDQNDNSTQKFLEDFVKRKKGVKTYTIIDEMLEIPDIIRPMEYLIQRIEPNALPSKLSPFKFSIVRMLFILALRNGFFTVKEGFISMSPLELKKKLKLWASKLVSPKYKYIDEINDSISEFINASRVEFDVIDPIVFLEKPILFPGIILKQKNKKEVLFTGPYLWTSYWSFVEISFTEFRENFPHVVNKLISDDNKTLDLLQNYIEKSEWQSLHSSSILPLGFWEYDILKKTFGDHGQIDFLGIFFHRKWFICIGEIKSIKGPNSIVNHYFKNYYSKLDDACSQLEKSKKAIENNMDKFLEWVEKKVSKDIFDSLKAEKQISIIKSVYVAPVNTYRLNDKDIWIIDPRIKREYNLRQLDFVITVEEMKDKLETGNFHLFEWNADKWNLILSTSDPKEIYSKLGIQLLENISSNTMSALKDFKYQFLKV